MSGRHMKGREIPVALLFCLSVLTGCGSSVEQGNPVWTDDVVIVEPHLIIRVTSSIERVTSEIVGQAEIDASIGDALRLEVCVGSCGSKLDQLADSTKANWDWRVYEALKNGDWLPMKVTSGKTTLLMQAVCVGGKSILLGLHVVLRDRNNDEITMASELLKPNGYLAKESGGQVQPPEPIKVWPLQTICIEDEPAPAKGQ
jgi:hypothetical protein